MQTPYQILDVAVDASDKAIKQAIKLEPILRKGYNAKKNIKGLLKKGKH